MSGTILIIEDEAILARSIKRSLEREAYEVVVEDSGESGLEAFRRVGPALVLLDLRLPGGLCGMGVLRTIREQGHDLPVIVMSAHADVRTAVEAMRLGAYDYVSKPVDLDELKLVVARALGHAQLAHELTYFRERADREQRAALPLGECPEMRSVGEQIERIARTERPGGGAPSVLVLGETGTGKSLVARAIHRLSPRSAGPFIDVNCGALPDTLLEAELFGYEKGAFTDARGTRAGLFEAADRGTLFLDEVGHLNLSAQTKLLKVIEEKTFRRLGSTAERRVDVRIIAATNRDLGAAQAAGDFRPELYHRLKVLTIDLPPLRERGADVLLLAEHFVHHHAEQYSLPARKLAPGAREILLGYGWPGNIRELANEIERAVLLETGDQITLGHLRGALRAPAAPTTIRLDGKQRVAVDLPGEGIAFDAIESAVLRRALEMNDWNVTRTARFLRLSRDTLRYRIERLSLASAG